ncbi:MAG: hypothetical protein ACE5GE_05055 [Phycisphaerae bacterium]
MKAKRSSYWMVVLVGGTLAGSAWAETPLSRAAKAGAGPLVVLGHDAPHMPGHPRVLPPAMPLRETPEPAPPVPTPVVSSETVTQPAAPLGPLAVVAARHGATPRVQRPNWKYIPKRTWRYRPARRTAFRPIRHANYRPKRSFTYHPRQ